MEQGIAHQARKQGRQRQIAAELERHHQLIERRAVVDSGDAGVIRGRVVEAGAAAYGIAAAGQGHGALAAARAARDEVLFAAAGAECIAPAGAAQCATGGQQRRQARGKLAGSQWQSGKHGSRIVVRSGVN